MAKKKTEQRVADTILQRDFTISAAGRSFTVPAPTLGTLIMVSEYIGDLPELSDGDNVSDILANAKHGREIAMILAIYILGAKAIKEANKPDTGRHLFGAKRISHPTPLEQLAEDIEDSFTPGDINGMFSQLLRETDFASFFVVTTFLREASLTKPTKVETTASGQS